MIWTSQQSSESSLYLSSLYRNDCTDVYRQSRDWISFAKFPDDVDNRLVTMLLVCKQLSAEGLSTFYRTNIFSFAGPTSFHIFISRLSSTKSSLLRSIELIAVDDNQALGSLIAEEYLAAPPCFWTLGESDMNVLSKLASVTHINIDVSVKGWFRPGAVWDFGRARRVSHMNRWLRYVFGGLRALRSIRRLDIDIACQDNCSSFKRGMRESFDEFGDMDQATLSSIIDDFKREVLSNAGGLTCSAAEKRVGSC